MTENARRMFRHFVPVDDCPHSFTLTHDPVAFATSGDDLVDFWAENDPRAAASERVFQVFGTGQPIPGGARWVGTPPRTPLGLVWHLFELQDEPFMARYLPGATPFAIDRGQS